jgi:hypothetical protein
VYVLKATVIMERVIISACIYLNSSPTLMKERMLRNAVRWKRLILDLGQWDLHKKRGTIFRSLAITFHHFLTFVLRHRHPIVSSRTVDRDLALSIWTSQEQTNVNYVSILLSGIHTDQVSEYTAIDWLIWQRILNADESNHRASLHCVHCI